MLKNVLTSPKFPCSKCGSSNTVLARKPLSQQSKIEKLLSLHKVIAKPPFLGHVFVCCEECKVEVALQVM